MVEVCLPKALQRHTHTIAAKSAHVAPSPPRTSSKAATSRSAYEVAPRAASAGTMDPWHRR
jgi:hypothetical protein